MMKVHAIVVAAGSGTRFGSEVPKQFLPLAGKPVVVRAIESLRPCVDGRIVIAISPSEEGRWRLIAKEYGLEHLIVAHGGSTRYESVHNALLALGGPALDGRKARQEVPPCRRDSQSESPLVGHNDIVLIHDGARPLPSQNLVMDVIEGAKSHDGAIPGIPVTDSLRRGTASRSDAVDRSRYFVVQTPQGFPIDLLLQAYHRAETMIHHDKPFTDDASVMENAGFTDLVITPGDPRNIKITNPLDISIAELYLKQ